MIDCFATNVPEPAIVVDGDDFAILLPIGMEELADTLATLLSGIHTVNVPRVPDRRGAA